MAELTGLARRSFLDLFLLAYTRAHGTTYVGDPQEVEHEDWDYRWLLAGSPALLVQHTRASSNELEERAKRALAGQWGHDEIHRHLLDALPRGTKLNVLVHQLPTTASDRQFMGGVIRRHVLGSVSTALAPGQTRNLPSFAERGGMAEIELEGIALDQRQISVKGPPFKFDHNKVAPRGIEALRKKQSRYGPQPSAVVLTIFFDLTGYEERDLAEMRESFGGEQIAFREVWAVNPFQPGARADCVWPIKPAEPDERRIP